MTTLLKIVITLSLLCPQMPTIATSKPPSGGSPTWTILNATYCSNLTCPGGGTISGSTLTITVPSTTAGAKGQLWALYGGGTQRTISSVTGESLTVGGTSCNGFDSIIGGADCAYITSEAGGKTSITVNLSGTFTSFAAVYYVEATSTNAASLDTLDKATQPGCTTCAAPAMASFAGTNDFVTQVALPANSCTAVSGSYTDNSSAITDGASAAYKLNVASYAAPNHTCSPSGDVVVAALALKQ